MWFLISHKRTISPLLVVVVVVAIVEVLTTAADDVGITGVVTTGEEGDNDMLVVDGTITMDVGMMGARIIP